LTDITISCAEAWASVRSRRPPASSRRRPKSKRSPPDPAQVVIKRGSGHGKQTPAIAGRISTTGVSIMSGPGKTAAPASRGKVVDGSNVQRW